jgi:hypothetical protein
MEVVESSQKAQKGRLKTKKGVEEKLTSGEASPLVAASEFNVEVGDQGVDVVVPLHLQTERRGERQVVYLHRVDVHLL